MKLDTAKQIASHCPWGVRLTEDYSGRGMYGDTTAAVSGDRGAVLQAVADAGFKPGDFRRDALGMGIVLY